MVKEIVTLIIKDLLNWDYQFVTCSFKPVFSVFPAEACETIGGDACLAEMYPDIRLQPEARNERARALEATEREYFEYNEAKTKNSFTVVRCISVVNVCRINKHDIAVVYRVFKAEACDNLGGIFCEREYQRGVY